MARKTKVVTISASKEEGGRDAGKTFLITEKDAVASEKWAIRVMLAMLHAGIDIPEEVLSLGVGAVVAAGFKTLTTMSFEEAEPLLEEMFDCISVIPDPKRSDITRPLDREDIEEVRTLFLLRSEVIEIHVGFSLAAFLSTLGSAAQAKQSKQPDTPTSPLSSET